ncbi:MAG: protein-glutamate O-methyltransferase [Candidatus Kuenenia sp.]|nr:protein-glutamate O-methyltransferase [Candidatus Kuenenia hertensis]
MSHKDFARFSKFIYDDYGIKLTTSKKTMLESRLQRRLRNLAIKTFGEYYDFVFSPEGIKSEMIHLIDAVTTNKTEFFREPGCFDYLLENALPKLAELYGAGFRRNFRVWSAGCSSGEEPYTLAMVLNKFKNQYPEFRFSILATDISTKMLKVAIRAVYEQEKILPVPEVKKRKYFMTSRDREKNLVRVIPELRSLVTFQRLNLMDGDFGIDGHMDIIFCRNVIIYFDRNTQEKLINRLSNQLVQGGYLFLGHSEILTNMNVPLERVSPTVYMKKR